MAEQHADFGEASAAFGEHYDQVRGYVRQQVTRANLDKDLKISTSSNKLLIADVGGGEGHDSEWAARFGHKVVLFEPLPSAFKAAQSRARRTRVPFTAIQGDAETAFEYSGEVSPFDLVMSHGVLQYQEDPHAHLRYLAGMLDKQGSLSLLTAGLSGKIARHLGREDFETVESLIATGQYTNNHNVRAKAYSSAELSRLVKLAGFNRLSWYGVRVSEVVDRDERKIADIDQTILDNIVAGEVRLSRAEDSRGMGQMQHTIARIR